MLIALDRIVRGVPCVYCETETFVQPGSSVPGPAFTHMYLHFPLIITHRLGGTHLLDQAA